MKFLIQHNLLSDNQLGLIKDALVDNNLPHEFVGLIPFSKEVTSEEPLEGKNFIPYGSTSFIKAAMKEGWEGLSFNKDLFRCDVWWDCHNNMLNRGVLLSVREAIDYFREGNSGLYRTRFIRPVDDLKKFSGMVDTFPNILKFLEDALEAESSTGEMLQEDDEVVVCPPIEIFYEARYFVVGGEVIDGSLYRVHGELRPSKPPETLDDTARKFASDWLPHRNCVMDIASTSGGVGVLEFNCINASGFYDNDIGKIFTALYKDSNNG